jgi:hypothetical protein
MISFRKWLQDIFKPSEMQYREASLEDVHAALQDQAVRTLWLMEIVLKIQQMNMELDNLLAKPDKERIWETFAIERRTLLRCVQMILDARDVLNSEREDQELQNRRAERIAQSTAAPLDLRQSQ